MDLLSTFTPFDWAVVGIIGLMAIGGVIRGFTHEAVTLAGWILAIVAVRMFHEQATDWLLPRAGGEASAATIAFIGLFFGTALVARLVAGIAGGLARRSMIGPMDRLLGLGFGALKGLILSAALFVMTQFATGLFDADREPPDWLRDSRSAPVLSLAANVMVTWVQDLDAGKDAMAAGMLPKSIPMPPGHPQLDPQYPPAPGANEGGYSQSDREALDKLLDQGAQKGDEVEI